jgi:hypothetical protein
MAQRWERKTVADNRGKPLEVLCWRDYELACEVNLGEQGGWVYQLTERGLRVELFPQERPGREFAEQREEQRALAAATQQTLEVETSLFGSALEEP